MKKIIVASKNPVKMAATLRGFTLMFPEESFQMEGVSVASDVGEQPMSQRETLDGAFNRAHNAAQEMPEADYWVGIEGGIEVQENEMHCFAWMVVRSKEGKYGKGRTGTFILPTEIAELIRGGMELGHADDVVFGRTNSKQSNGAVGILTNDVIDRTNYYADAVVLALIPFKNPTLYLFV